LQAFLPIFPSKLKKFYCPFFNFLSDPESPAVGYVHGFFFAPYPPSGVAVKTDDQVRASVDVRSPGSILTRALMRAVFPFKLSPRRPVKTENPAPAIIPVFGEELGPKPNFAAQVSS
jgi:hypothetical protein